MIKLKDPSPEHFVFRNQLAIDPNQNLYDFKFSPLISIKALEPGCEVFKIGKESNFTRGIYEGILAVVLTKNSLGQNSKRYNVVAISAMGNDTQFAEGGDSGSIYYTSRGSFRYPFAIHNGEAYEKMTVLRPDLFEVPKNHRPFVTRRLFYGTPLGYALKKLNLVIAKDDETEEKEEEKEDDEEEHYVAKDDETEEKEDDEEEHYDFAQDFSWLDRISMLPTTTTADGSSTKLEGEK